MPVNHWDQISTRVSPWARFLTFTALLSTLMTFEKREIWREAQKILGRDLSEEAFYSRDRRSDTIRCYLLKGGGEYRES